MTQTEKIANRVYDRLAAQCELLAAEPGMSEWQRIQLNARANDYRKAQEEELIRRLDDWNLTHEAENDDQAHSLSEYPYDNILMPSRAFDWTTYALLAVAAALLLIMLI